jgi:hypothetical protein
MLLLYPRFSPSRFPPGFRTALSLFFSLALSLLAIFPFFPYDSFSTNSLVKLSYSDDLFLYLVSGVW